MTKLADLQYWLAGEISQPLGSAVSELAKSYIAPSATLKPEARVILYREQFWWRLLDTLQQNFPFLTRLLGFTAFNERISVPYLKTHLPTHWALCQLGETLPQWIEEDCPGDDRELLICAAQLDWAIQEAFWIGVKPAIDFSTLSEEEIVSISLTLQPHIHLFAFDFECIELRDSLMKEEADYWQANELPTLNKELCFYVVYRDLSNHVRSKKLSEGEYLMLTYFQEGSTITDACDKIEQAALEEAEIALPIWFRSWTSLQWFTASVAHILEPSQAHY